MSLGRGRSDRAVDASRTADAALSAEEATGLLSMAILAPSLHNSQPWHFVARPHGLEIHVEPRRSLPVADPSGRAARIACGAALYNLRLAMVVQLGREPVLDYRPERHDPRFVASIRPGRARAATPSERAQHAAIPQRHSNRYPFLDRSAVAAHQQTALANAADSQGCWLKQLTEATAIRRLTALVDEAGRILDADPDYRQELRRWVRPSGQPGGGITAAAAGPRPEPGDTLRMRDYGGRARGPGRDFERSPLLAVLGGSDDSRTTQIAVGQALQAVLLTATRDGLAVSLFSQPGEVESTRRGLRELTGLLGTAYLVLRVGYPLRPSPSTPRRPVTEVSQFTTA